MSSTDKIIGDLKERAKELRCIYRVEKVLNRIDCPTDEVLYGVVEVIGPGWKFPNLCVVAITVEGRVFFSNGFRDTPDFLQADIISQNEVVGNIQVHYTQECPQEDKGPFLKEEVELIQSIADRLGHFLFFKKLQNMGAKWNELGEMSEHNEAENWRAVVDLLRETDDTLFVRVSRKMLNYLCSIGIPEAQDMLGAIDLKYDRFSTGTGEKNVPEARCPIDLSLLLKGKPFDLASRFISGQEIVFYIQKWIQEDKASSFLNVLDSPRSTLGEIQDALRRFQRSALDGLGLPAWTMKSVRISLTKRILTEQLDYLQTAKDYMSVSFFQHLMDRVVMPQDSHGKLGGKAAGMLLAYNILQKKGITPAAQNSAMLRPVEPIDTDLDWDLLKEIKIPRTWHIASDAILDFIAYNDLDEVLHQKYKPIDEVRQEYPNIIRLFINSSFPHSLIHGFSAALDEFDGVPIVVRSSSLLEDRAGSAFSGKYKSLFLPNQGTKKECLEALLDAVAEIYASMFGPDPIEYRAERGVLEFDEQMGILIQEVVGSRVGKYFFPSFAGVAFSKNEFRWSPRIEREDGLIRLVPGLGTRAVDRTGDDFPVLIVPGKPDLRVNVVVDEVLRYSPNKMDVINLESNSFDTVGISDLLKEVDGKYNGLPMVFSILDDGRLVKPVSTLLDMNKTELVATFDETRSNTKFMQQVRGLLKVLEETMNTPVDVEFAHDGHDLYLLQCRPQSQANWAAAAPIPRDLPDDEILFSANRFVSNGSMEEISFVVYVDPDQYGNLPTKARMKEVGRAVAKLNKVLPRKKFILMGPGRWGSKGDIKLGVNVSYADINNTAMLIEIARRKGSYVPDVSFGTHFFQDLVEAEIGYLPLYPDDEDIKFGESFLLKSENVFAELVPEYADLSSVIHVIDIEKASEGRLLKVLLNADLDEAVACFCDPGSSIDKVTVPDNIEPQQPMQFWSWRKQMASQIAAELDHIHFGVVAVYLFGSVKNAIAGPASDIDLLIHFRGNRQQQTELLQWLDGWSRCLAEVNYLKTGYKTDGLLDVHLVTDQDIKKRTSYAVKIGAITDAAYELPLGDA